MIRVYHGPDELVLGAVLLDDERLLSRVRERTEEYHLVAQVATNSLDEAFRLTNTLESAWWENAEVAFFGSAQYGLKGARSTSIGDVFECANKERYVVSRIGFVLLPDPKK